MALRYWRTILGNEDALKPIEFRIVRMEHQHLAHAVDVHYYAFPGFFLTFLGRPFLYQFYLATIDEPSGISFVAQNIQNGAIIGVVLGTTSPTGFFRKLVLRRWWRFGLATLNTSICHPKIIFRLARALQYRGDSSGMTGLALLSSIAVTPEQQGYGVGKALVTRFLEEVKGQGLAGAYLTTDARRNDTVLGFYQRNGWKRDCEFCTHEGRRMVRYTIFFSGS